MTIPSTLLTRTRLRIAGQRSVPSRRLRKRILLAISESLSRARHGRGIPLVGADRSRKCQRAGCGGARGTMQTFLRHRADYTGAPWPRSRSGDILRRQPETARRPAPRRHAREVGRAGGQQICGHLGPRASDAEHDCASPADFDQDVRNPSRFGMVRQREGAAAG